MHEKGPSTVALLGDAKAKRHFLSFSSAISSHALGTETSTHTEYNCGQTTSHSSHCTSNTSRVLWQINWWKSNIRNYHLITRLELFAPLNQRKPDGASGLPRTARRVSPSSALALWPAIYLLLPRYVNREVRIVSTVPSSNLSVVLARYCYFSADYHSGHASGIITRAAAAAIVILVESCISIRRSFVFQLHCCGTFSRKPPRASLTIPTICNV